MKLRLFGADLTAAGVLGSELQAHPRMSHAGYSSPNQGGEQRRHTPLRRARRARHPRLLVYAVSCRREAPAKAAWLDGLGTLAELTGFTLKPHACHKHQDGHGLPANTVHASPSDPLDHDPASWALANETSKLVRLSRDDGLKHPQHSRYWC